MFEVRLGWRPHVLLNIDPTILDTAVVGICDAIDVNVTPQYRAECAALLQRILLHLADLEGGEQ
jgi:hypothetical protein